ncbi:hypothetical protein N657DRAFT_574109 [Parathielavia appendiculata]|uniref:Zn(2)-C6 fungal-type domain-containing protein n=1 Tax=Parathielavia appendiculata TaxID=2587402 RepID=A0AAN6TYE5_9PEZI|nr:hypothetical protein N657DRAFT_574109 [Parathielavia appendiculata]
MEIPGATKRTRASKPKVRTGCITCKIRRVKCDEAKPRCHRCTSTGRQCDGYLAAVSSVPPSVRAIGGQRQGHEPSQQENRALGFFFRQTAPGLSGFFGQAFWRGCVLHLSISEPAVRYALTSLGTMHEALCRDGVCDPTTFALHSYNKSIRSLAHKGAAGPETAITYLICSIIFTCFEFLRGNVEAAVTHVNSGINILGMVRRQAEVSCSNGSPGGEQIYPSFESNFVETELAPILSTLSIATSEFGSPDHGFFLNPVDANGLFVFSDTFDSVAEARCGLIDLTTALIKARHDYIGASTRAGSSTKLLERLRQDLERWRVKFDDVVRRQQDAWGRRDRDAADVVRIMFLTTRIGTSLCFSDGESAWDSHRAGFEDIVARAEALLSDRNSSREAAQGFSVELGLTCPLHMVAWKCRWPHIRRRGLALVRRLPKRDFIFDSEHYHAVFSRIMAIEEAHLDLPPGTSPEEDTLPPEHVRVHHFYSVPRFELGRNIYAVTFLTKPNGLDREWQYRTEYLNLDTLQSLEAGTTGHMAPVSNPLPDLVRAIMVQGAG